MRAEQVALTYKNEDLRPGAAILDYERAVPRRVSRPHWQTEDSLLRRSWGWVEPPLLLDETELVPELLDVVSKGGNLLLGVPPRADGSFDDRVVATVEAIGTWLAVQGVGVYASVPWGDNYGEGPTRAPTANESAWSAFTTRDFRFTSAAKGEALFVYVMRWAANVSYTVTSLNSSAALRRPGAQDAQVAPEGVVTVTNVSVIGSPELVNWRQDKRGLHISSLPRPHHPRLPVGLRVHLDGATTAQVDAPSLQYRSRIGRTF